MSILKLLVNARKIKMMLRSLLVLLVLLAFPYINYAKEYNRIISLSPSVTKSLYEFGAEDYVKGITVFCPKGTIKKEVIGTLLEPNIERIIYMKPDLIVASKDGNGRTIVDKLQRLGFEVYVMEKSESFDDICSNYHLLAEKINKTSEANNLITKARVLLQKIRDNYNLRKSDTLKVFWEIGNSPLFTAGGKSFANDYNFYSNTVNIYRDVNKNYFQVDLEDVIRRNPDVILLVNSNVTLKSDILFWRKYEIINAVRSNRVFVINSEDMFTATPMIFLKNVRLLLDVIYKEVLNV